MGILEEAKMAVEKINAMKINGATSTQLAIDASQNPLENSDLVSCVATFSQGYRKWIADDGLEPLYGISYYPITKMAYICINPIYRYGHYTPNEATNNYCPFPEPNSEGIYPYVYGMLVWPNMKVNYKDENYICTLPSGTYKLVYTPIEVPSIFTKE